MVVLETVVVIGRAVVLVVVDVVVVTVEVVEVVEVVKVVEVVGVVDVVEVVGVVDVVEIVEVIVVNWVVVVKVEIGDMERFILKKSSRKGRSCVEPDVVVVVVVVVVESSDSLDVVLRMLSKSDQVNSWFNPLLTVEADMADFSVVFSYKVGFNERDSKDTTDPLPRIMDGISLSISSGNSKTS